MNEPIVLKSAIELITSRPDIYFRDGRPTVEALIEGIVSDALGGGARNLRVWREDRHALVCADVDWMVTSDATLDRLFSQLVMTTPRRVNCHRAEVLVAAVCDGFLTVGLGGECASNPIWSDLPPRFASETTGFSR